MTLKDAHSRTTFTVTNDNDCAGWGVPLVSMGALEAVGFGISLAGKTPHLTAPDAQGGGRITVIRNGNHFFLEVEEPHETTAAATPAGVLLYEDFAGTGAYARGHALAGGIVSGLTESNPTKQAMLLRDHPNATLQPPTRET